MDEQLAAIVRAQPWVMGLLDAVRAEQLSDAWIGAGLLRDLVWGERFGSGFDPDQVRDVDVAFFDLTDLRRAHHDDITERLRRRLPGVPWEAKNQAAVHFPVKCFCSGFRAVRAWKGRWSRPCRHTSCRASSATDYTAFIDVREPSGEPAAEPTPAHRNH